MKMNALRALVNNPFKESFYGKRKKTVHIYLYIFEEIKLSCTHIYPKSTHNDNNLCM